MTLDGDAELLMSPRFQRLAWQGLRAGANSTSDTMFTFWPVISYKTLIKAMRVRYTCDCFRSMPREPCLS